MSINLGLESFSDEPTLNDFNKSMGNIGYPEYIITRDGMIWGRTQKKWLKYVSDKDKYKRVILCHEGKVKAFNVHRLVGEVFVPTAKRYGAKIGLDKLEINHIDCNRSNNKASNLEWCKPEENKLIMMINKAGNKNISVKSLIEMSKMDSNKLKTKYRLSDNVIQLVKNIYKPKEDTDKS